MRVAIITGSTRQNRKSATVANWVLEHTNKHYRSESFDLIDLRDFQLPFLGEATTSQTTGEYDTAVQTWAQTIEQYDAFILVVPEYNHSYPAVIKNALDLLGQQWAHKAVGFVTYGLQGGVRAAEHLRCVVAELKMASVQRNVALSLIHDFAEETASNPGSVTPSSYQLTHLDQLIQDLLTWGEALRQARIQTHHSAPSATN